ncbi:uncharacterized protein CDV56_101770 [Aspergillus thermomutatus]|uniref:Uncharacterized protein n=1 Tax=Aspergillus thermomutatus TaxID=41047 RepID=A0A397FY84_ASPTH|nr:uncharacterized protein CDV56_101770 [Aspergillus thermomutatus]RHZ43635.1 hypothetical protein CDV56_101770 [Aspergillus thermomutatus]
MDPAAIAWWAFAYLKARGVTREWAFHQLQRKGVTDTWEVQSYEELRAFGKADQQTDQPHQNEITEETTEANADANMGTENATTTNTATEVPVNESNPQAPETTHRTEVAAWIGQSDISNILIPTFRDHAEEPDVFVRRVCSNMISNIAIFARLWTASEAMTNASCKYTGIYKVQSNQSLV